ncbi:MAG: alkaline phosphatase family protein [Actinomycetota bacterium]|nr:alkaline phosphatase family protein [Actinomycetota bacterium]
MAPPKLVLAVIDGLAPAALEQGIAEGTAPTLAALMERGVYIDDCVAAFPSVTPVCTASIVTGTGPDQHRIPGMNWYLRSEARYVEYGSSLQATRSFGIGRSLTDTIYNLNLGHLSRTTPTIFESLDDAGVRTAGTTFLMYRGRHRHEASGESALARLVAATLFRHAVWGPRELFYADLFASRETGCRSQLGLPGARDQHAGCVGAFLVEHDLFDFLLLSLPDNDTHSHRTGPDGQVQSLILADAQLERLVNAGGGIDAFLEEHAIIVMADHSHSPIEHRASLRSGFADLRVLAPNDPRPELAHIAVCPGWRSGMVYVLDEDHRERLTRRAARLAERIEGVDLVIRRAGEEAVVWSPRGELRFAPGTGAADLAGHRWSFQGDLAAVGARVEDGTLYSEEYPDALGRLWSALHCENAGEVLLSAVPGYEFTDWGGVDHVGGGSHGSLHRGDSLGTLLCVGAGPGSRDERRQWSLRDIAPMVRGHFGLS